MENKLWAHATLGRGAARSGEGLVDSDTIIRMDQPEPEAEAEPHRVDAFRVVDEVEQITDRTPPIAYRRRQRAYRSCGGLWADWVIGLLGLLGCWAVGRLGGLVGAAHRAVNGRAQAMR